jgi:hypothetical protein
MPGMILLEALIVASISVLLFLTLEGEKTTLKSEGRLLADKIAVSI